MSRFLTPSIGRSARMERLELDADWVVQRFRLVYLYAMQDRDYSAAIRALENIGKFLGIFEQHNRQKRKELTPEECDRLKAELETRGYDFSRRNFPPHLVGVRSCAVQRDLPTRANIV